MYPYGSWVLKERGDAWRRLCVGCSLLHVYFSARFLPLLHHLLPPSTDHIWTSSRPSLSLIFFLGLNLSRSMKFEHFTCVPLASLFY